MLRIKKLDIFILKSFLLLFLGTFFICLFIFMMQSLWLRIDELVGKGLEISILAKFFFYSALTLIPMSLPLAVLLAALMTFGNFGERYELLAMKAAGIPLLRIMRPLILFCVFLCGTSFYFQNVISPEARLKMLTLLVSMKQTSPELDIPEGAFYDEIDGYNIYVRHKDRKAGLLKDVLIYNFSDGFENARIIWATEGRMETTADKQHLYLHLFDGEQFENLKSQTISSDNVPYRRETFREKHTLIEFDGGFNLIDGNFLTGRSDSKNMIEISHSIDSLNQRADSLGRSMYHELTTSTYRPVVLSPTDSVKLAAAGDDGRINTDSLFDAYTLAEKDKVLGSAADRAEALAGEWNMKSFSTTEADKSIREHKADWHKKITLSVGCLIFFFIGAPLGAIIRKGGLGMPVVVSVLIFIIYYIIDSGATRVAKSGEMNMVLGVWMSTLVLAPVGAFFTYKSNKDSVVFNAEVYVGFLRMLLGLRSSRHVVRKEVIIEDPDYRQLSSALEELCADCRAYLSGRRPPGYFRTFFGSGGSDDSVARINARMEQVIEELSNSKDGLLLNRLNGYPVLSVNAHQTPFKARWANVLAGAVVPAGLVVFLRVRRFSRRIDKDLEVVIETSRDLQARISSLTVDN